MDASGGCCHNPGPAVLTHVSTSAGGPEAAWRDEGSSAAGADRAGGPDRGAPAVELSGVVPG